MERCALVIKGLVYGWEQALCWEPSPEIWQRSRRGHLPCGSLSFPVVSELHLLAELLEGCLPWMAWKLTGTVCWGSLSCHWLRSSWPHLLSSPELCYAQDELLWSLLARRYMHLSLYVSVRLSVCPLTTVKQQLLQSHWCNFHNLVRMLLWYGHLKIAKIMVIWLLI